VEILPWLEVEAKERMMAGKPIDPTQKFAGGEAREQAAKLTGTNRQYVSDAKQIKDSAPELLDKVKEGTMNLSRLKKLAGMLEEQREIAFNRWPGWKYAVAGG
jgi:hypothetical protein